MWFYKFLTKRKARRRLKQAHSWKLYDMERDRTEMDDLSGKEPKLVETLARKWDAWPPRIRSAHASSVSLSPIRMD